MTYAKTTSVPVAKSRMEIEKMLLKHKADQFVNGWDGEKAMIGFRMKGRFIRLTLPINQEKRLSDNQKAQLERTKWRALTLVIKAKLEAVEAGIVLFEDEFLAHIVMPDNHTVGQHVRPKIEESYKTGKLPLLLPPTTMLIEGAAK